MADSHPKNLDPRPKRRRDEENPYEIYTAGVNTAHPHYFLAFTDSSKVKRWMEIDKTLCSMRSMSLSWTIFLFSMKWTGTMRNPR